MARQRHLKRYRQIIRVLARNGFAVMLEQAGLFSYLKLRKKSVMAQSAEKAGNARLTVGERLRMSCEELGPTFIKIGQIISTRPDIVSPEVAQELSKLQEAVNPFPFDEVKDVIEMSFSEPLEAIFSDFRQRPLAAASLSQVHQATLPTGKQVVVKVQRPGISESIEIDLDILSDLVHFIENRTKYGDLYDFSGMLSELDRTIHQELDFRKEGENADIFKRLFSKQPMVDVPLVHWIYTTDKVLTMSYVTGYRISQTAEMKNAGIDLTELGKRLASCISEQIFIQGFFHADPHPGNLIIQDDGSLVFLDLGMVGRLNENKRKILADMFVGIATQDAHQVVQAFLDMNTMRQRVNLRHFEADIERLLEQYMSLPVNEIKVGELLAEIFQLAFTYKIRLPAAFTLISKVLITLQGLLEKLDPDLNLLTLMKPVASRLMKERLSFDEIGRQVQRTGSDYYRLLRLLPTFFVNFFHKLEDDEYRIEFELKDIDKVQKHLDSIFNRISFSLILLGVSIIVAGIIIGTSMTAGAGPEMSRLNVLILRGGLVIAVAILLFLIISMIRSKKF